MLRAFKVAMAAASLVSASAQAALFDFSYDFSFTGPSGPVSGQLSGRIDGVLQSDNNNVLVNSLVGPVKLNGTDVMALPYTNAVSAHFQNPTFQSIAFVTLDGSDMTLIACESVLCVSGFLLDTNFTFGGTGFLSSPEFGSADAPYSARGWSMSPVTGGVPEPTSWAMLIAGFGLVGAASRRRSAAAA
jgi:PEP-CTERM motif